MLIRVEILTHILSIDTNIGKLFCEMFLSGVVTGTPGSYGDSFNIPQDQVIKVTFQTG